jgi:hypothetical protein
MSRTAPIQHFAQPFGGLWGAPPSRPRRSNDHVIAVPWRYETEVWDRRDFKGIPSVLVILAPPEPLNKILANVA